MAASTIFAPAPSYSWRCVQFQSKTRSKVNFFSSSSAPPGLGFFTVTWPVSVSMSTMRCRPSASSLPNSGRHRTTTCTHSEPRAAIAAPLFRRSLAAHALPPRG
uniref:Uncharacterized protein n=1 Tax=Mantoniella antarctica TaxID=81844 RepID=A0A7S0X3M5_9CHLO